MLSMNETAGNTCGRDVYIVDCIRTPIGLGRNTGSLHDIHPVSLLSYVLDSVTSRCNVNKAEVEGMFVLYCSFNSNELFSSSLIYTDY